jgi:acyl-CoA hydrolase
LTDWFGDGTLRRFRVRFAARVHPGDLLTCRARITKVTHAGGGIEVECDAWVDNQEGQRVIAGSAAATLKGSRP